jgi:hypothetical protein
MDKMVMDIRLVKYTPSSALIKHPEIKSKFLEKPFFFCCAVWAHIQLYFLFTNEKESRKNNETG